MNFKFDIKYFTLLVKIFLPIFVGIGIILAIGFLMDNNFRLKFWSLITGYFFPPFGKESIIPSGVALGINPIFMALSIAFVDIIVAWFLVWNYDLAKMIPLIGNFMNNIEKKGKNVEKKYAWIKPLRFVGIILFVMVPFQGSGGLVGSIVGRLIGMKPWNTFIAISIGAVIGTLLIATFSSFFIELAKINTTLTIILIIIIALIVVLYLSLIHI